MIGVFRERFFTFRMKLKMFITSSDHYLKYLAILFLVKASGLGDFVSQNPLFSYGAMLDGGRGWGQFDTFIRNFMTD